MSLDRHKNEAAQGGRLLRTTLRRPREYCKSGAGMRRTGSLAVRRLLRSDHRLDERCRYRPSDSRSGRLGCFPGQTMGSLRRRGMPFGALELYTTRELIEELMRRTTFLGVVVHSEEELRNGAW